jgi:integrase
VSKRTVPLYISALEAFCEFSGKTPSELIKQRDDELRSDDHNNRTGIRNLILDFRVYLEKGKYAPKTINAKDGAIRGFFSAVLGHGAIVNVKNYRNASIGQKKDLVPTLRELRKILEVCNIEEKFRIIFIAQTGMRISDALAIKLGDVQRELDLENSPLAITYVPEKDREAIGIRTTFLGSDGIEILKAYLRWRENLGEKLNPDSPLFTSRTDHGNSTIRPEKVNEMIHKVAKKAGLNGDWKYGVLRAHSFRKFFITQMTNHGVQDKVVDLFVGHSISEIDRVYWVRRVEELRKIYADRQQHLNPISLKQEYDLTKIEGLQAKLQELESKITKLSSKRETKLESKIVQSEVELLHYVSEGFDCQVVGTNKWLVKREITTELSGSDAQIAEKNVNLDNFINGVTEVRAKQQLLF